MNLCNTKQKAFAQRVYFDLKICRKWSKLHVYFDEINKWIFFLGKSLDNQPLTFVLPISSDEQLTVDDLFNLKSKLSSALKFDTDENIQSRDNSFSKKKYIPHLFIVLMAIIANDFTLAYFNFSFGLPTIILQSETTVNQNISMIDNEFINEIKKEITDNEWTTSDTTSTWN